MKQMRLAFFSAALCLAVLPSGLLVQAQDSRYAPRHDSQQFSAPECKAGLPEGLSGTLFPFGV
jgi:hypothetical protein